jgi:shikimate kinase
MKIYLIGFMGAGKTSKGRKLARKMGIRFFDMDQMIEDETGMSIQEIFDRKGELWFRKKEAELLKRLGSINDDIIISTGGGVPCYENNMEFINDTGLSVYLRLSSEALLERLIDSKKQERPLLKGKTREEMIKFVEQKLEEREPFYLMSKLIIPSENLKVKEILARIMQLG